MAEATRSRLYTIWVTLASAVGVGLPAAFVFAVLFSQPLEALGTDPAGFSTPATFVFWGVALLFGMLVANEVAAVQLGGYDALTRGSPATAVSRGALLTLTSLALVGAITWTVLSVFFRLSGPAPYVLALLVGLSWLLVLYRLSSAFVDGLRANGA